MTIVYAIGVAAVSMVFNHLLMINIVGGRMSNVYSVTDLANFGILAAIMYLIGKDK